MVVIVRRMRADAGHREPKEGGKAGGFLVENKGSKQKKVGGRKRGRKSSKRGSQRYMPGDMGDGRSTQRNTDLCLRRFGQKCLKLSRQIVKN